MVEFVGIHAGVDALKENSWTLSIIPHCGKSAKVYRVARWHIYGCAALVSVVVLSLAFLTYGRLIRRTREENLDQAQQENRILRSQLAAMEEKMIGLEGTIGQVMIAEQHFREVAGLSRIEPDVRNVGIGGPSFVSIDPRVSRWLESPAGKEFSDSDEQLSLLSRRADLVYQSLVESVEQLEYDNKKFSRTPSVWPTDGRISSGFGARRHPIFGDIRPHEGVDIYARKGTPIIATAEGKIIRAAWKVGYGLTVVIDHDYGYRTLYAHCSRIKKNKGDIVERGEVIALVGNTGVTTGPHLHYEVMVNGKNVNPANYILGNAIPD